jgi:outer membrane protein OmpA-like peptidoglycan-associated protein
VAYAHLGDRPLAFEDIIRLRRVKMIYSGCFGGSMNILYFKNLLAMSMLISVGVVSVSHAQDTLPRDNSNITYYTQPEWRSSEVHPLRLAAYLLHPVGWVAREVIGRPISYFASSTPTRRSVMGYRYPYDYRQPECFSPSDTVPDCHTLAPFNYSLGTATEDTGDVAQSQVYFPNVNFDFDRRQLNTLGKGVAKRIAKKLMEEEGLKVVLQGHADYLGSENYNDVLGMDRAKALKTELMQLGVPEDRVSTVSFGETSPLVDEQTDEARAVNRRVEVHLAE